MQDATGLPANIRAFIDTFDSALTETEFNDPRFAYRVLFVPKTANRKGQADKVIEFIKADSELAKDVNKHYAVVKETEKTKYLPKQVVEKMQLSGFPRFSMHGHTQLWKSLDAKNPSKKLGVLIVKTWYWYEPWLEVVTEHCFDNASAYS